MKTPLICILSVFFTSFGIGNGEVNPRVESVYGESVYIQTLSGAILSYVRDNEGEAPKSWSQLHLEEFDRDYTSARGMSLENTYKFINQEFDLPNGVGRAMIILMRTRPINIDNRSFDQRMFVYLQEGKVGSYSLPEAEAKKIFADAGKRLPGNSEEVDRESRIDGKGHYVAANPTPTPTGSGKPTLAASPNSMPHDISRQSNAAEQKSPQLTKTPWSTVLILGVILLVFLAVGALIFKRRG